MIVVFHAVSFLGGRGGGGDLAEPDQQVLLTSSRVLAIQLPYQLRAKPVCHCKLRLLFAGCRLQVYTVCEMLGNLKKSEI